MDPRTTEDDGDDSIPEASNKPGAKRRASRAGSRSVATLNVEQLARKRANDREAQRSIRQRTKDHVERLENRVRELTEGQCINLEEVRVRNAELERELREIKDSLQVNEDGMGSDYGSSPAQGSWAGSYPNGSMSAYTSSADAWSPTFQHALNSTPESAMNGPFSNPYGQVLPNTALPLGMGTQFTQSLEQLGQNSRWLVQAVPPDPRMLPQISASRGSTSKHVSGTPPLPQNRPAWELQLRLVPPSCPVDHLILSIVQRQRSLLAAGARETDVVGLPQPSMRLLAYPGQVDDGNPISTIIANLLQRTPLPELPERVACLFVMYRLTRWHLAPSQETYTSIPEWFRPRASQVLTPHPVWVSHVPFGRLRDKVIANQELYATDEFQALYTASLSVNWPKQDFDILAFQGDDVKASDEFERHIMNLANWTLTDPFTRRYPELAEYCNFKWTQTSQQIPGLPQY